MVLIGLLASEIKCDEKRVAVAYIVSQNVTGNIKFTETDEGLHVTGTLVGLAEGHYGFHVHELGDISDCDAAGSHFDLDGNNHGGRDHDMRHIGDLGNLIFVGNDSAVATVDFVDTVISLRGRTSILGRSLMVHEQEDDLGQGGHDNSLTTGNAGARVACGVIGIKSPASPWNAATSAGPSVTLLASLIFWSFFKN